MMTRKRWRGSVFEVSGSGDAEDRSGSQASPPPCLLNLWNSIAL
jgi:hypothetical protein